MNVNKVFLLSLSLNTFLLKFQAPPFQINPHHTRTSIISAHFTGKCRWYLAPRRCIHQKTASENERCSIFHLWVLSHPPFVFIFARDQQLNYKSNLDIDIKTGLAKSYRSQPKLWTLLLGLHSTINTPPSPLKKETFLIRFLKLPESPARLSLPKINLSHYGSMKATHCYTNI